MLLLQHTEIEHHLIPADLNEQGMGAENFVGQGENAVMLFPFAEFRAEADLFGGICRKEGILSRSGLFPVRNVQLRGVEQQGEAGVQEHQRIAEHGFAKGNQLLQGTAVHQPAEDPRLQILIMPENSGQVIELGTQTHFGPVHVPDQDVSVGPGQGVALRMAQNDQRNVVRTAKTGGNLLGIQYITYRVVPFHPLLPEHQGIQTHLIRSGGTGGDNLHIPAVQAQGDQFQTQLQGKYPLSRVIRWYYHNRNRQRCQNCLCSGNTYWRK